MKRFVVLGIALVFCVHPPVTDAKPVAKTPLEQACKGLCVQAAPALPKRSDKRVEAVTMNGDRVTVDLACTATL